MKTFRNNQKALVFELLIAAAMAVVIFFALMNIGTYINGTIGESLEDTLPTNTASGSINSDYWDNASGNGTIAYRNTSLSSGCSVGEIKSTSGINVYNNGTDPMWFNLTVNGGHEYYNKSIASLTWDNVTLATLVTASNMSNGDTYVNVSWLTNRTHNRVYQYYVGSYYVSGDYRSSLQNDTYDNLGTISVGFDDNIDVMIIAAIITVITIPLAAVIAIKRLL